MQTRMFEIMARIDEICEQPPIEPYEQLAAMKIAWPSDTSIEVDVAASRIMEGLWLYSLGNACPDEWDTFTWKGVEIASDEDAPLGFHLMQAGIALRNAGCRQASWCASPAQLARIRTQMPLSHSPHEQALREVTVAWMERLYAQWHDEQDWFGSPLPAAIDDLSVAFARSAPYRKQGNTSVVTPIALDKQQYFTKQLIQPGPLLTLFEAFQTECAVTAMMKVLPMKLGPHTGCLYAGDDGTLTYLSNKVPGLTMTNLRTAASRVSLAAVQAAVLAEVIGNVKDRHHENIFIDRLRAQPWLIDFAHALNEEMEPLELPDATRPLAAQREAFTRALWTWHPDCLRTEHGEAIILDDVLQGVLGVRAAILAALRPFDLPDAAHAIVARRLDALEQLAHQDGDKTVEGLNRLLLA